METKTDKRTPEQIIGELRLMDQQILNVVRDGPKRDTIFKEAADLITQLLVSVQEAGVLIKEFTSENKSDSDKVEKKAFSKVRIGSKIKDFAVLWGDGNTTWHLARKIDSKTVKLLDGKEHDVSVLVEPVRIVNVIEGPHEDSDFSYMCGQPEYCRCGQ